MKPLQWKKNANVRCRLIAFPSFCMYQCREQLRGLSSLSSL